MRMANLSLHELKIIAKSRGIKDYENKSENTLTKILNKPKTKISLSKKKNNIRKDFNELRYRFSKSNKRYSKKSL